MIQVTISLSPDLPTKILEQLQNDKEVIDYLSNISAQLTKEFTAKGELALSSHLGKKLIESHRIIEAPSNEPQQESCDTEVKEEKQTAKRSRRRTSNNHKIS